MIKNYIISKYLIKEILFSFVISFLFFFFVFFVNQILYLMGQMLKELPFWEVMKLVWYSLPIVIALSFPFGVLVGSLMAIGKLSFDNEILACLSSGISYIKIYIPIIIIGVVLSLTSFVINDYLQPLGNSKSRKLRRELIQRNPDLILKPFSTKIYKERVIINGDVSPEKGIEDIVIIDRDEDGQKRVIMAKRAKMIDGELQQGLLTLSLDDVFSLSGDIHSKVEHKFFTSDYMKYNILFSDMQTTNTNISPQEMRSLDIYKGIKDFEKDLFTSNFNNYKKAAELKLQILQDYNSNIRKTTMDFEKLRGQVNEYVRLKEPKKETRSLRNWRIELYQKFAIPLSCLTFLLLSFPLGLTTKRSGKAMGFGIGLLITIVYWSILMGSRMYAYSSEFNVLLIVASPNIFILTITAILIPLRFRK